jgi:SAM-dependent methyltransferase
VTVPSNRAAAQWKRLGAVDPYFGVCSDAMFQRGRLDEAARARFFASGEQEISATLDVVRRHLIPDFTPRRALDFGCGVGRLSIPLARVAGTVVGVDVSPGMLEEARANARHAAVGNVTFAPSTPALDGVDGPFDFVHSYIVFQHIPPGDGYPLLDALLERLAPGGAGMLHFTYARRAPWLRRAVHAARRSVPLVNAAVNLAQRRPPGTPMLAMYEYDLPRVLGALAAHGCQDDLHLRLTDHGGHLGAMLFFVRSTTPADRAPPGELDGPGHG